MKRRVPTKGEMKFQHEISAKAKGKNREKRSRSFYNQSETVVEPEQLLKEAADHSQTNVEKNEFFVGESSTTQERKIGIDTIALDNRDKESCLKEKGADKMTDCQLLGKEILSELHAKGVSLENLGQNDLETFLKDIGKRKNLDPDTVGKIFQEYLENEKQKIVGLMMHLMRNKVPQSLLLDKEQLETQPSYSDSKQTEIGNEQETIESFDIKEQVYEEPTIYVDSDDCEDGKLDIVMPRTPAVELSEYNWSAENARSEETVIEGTLQQPPKSSINLFKQDSDGDTILHLATVQQHSSVDKLIDMMKNESLDVQNKRGQTALHLAVVLKQEDNIRRLIYAGASIAVVDCHGDTPLHIACRTGKQTLVSLLLQKLLISPSVGCESAMRTRNFEGETPLHIAVAHSFGTGNEAVIHLLVSNKCDVNLIEGKSGKTCLYMALENQNYRLANYLIDRGADVNIDAFSGTSPLHLACQAGDFDMVKKLLAKNAALTAKNAEYESPKDVAATDEIRRLLDKAMKKERRRKYKEKDDLKRSSPRT